MPTDEIRGRALATRRAATDITRTAVLGSYGVAGFEAGPAFTIVQLVPANSAAVSSEMNRSMVNLPRSCKRRDLVDYYCRVIAERAVAAFDAGNQKAFAAAVAYARR